LRAFDILIFEAVLGSDKSDGLAEGPAQLQGETDELAQQHNGSAPALFVAGAQQANDAGDTVYQFIAPKVYGCRLSIG
jgi:hypothetical protein